MRFPIQGSGLGLDSFANRPDYLQSPDYASSCGTDATESGHRPSQGSVRVIVASYRDHFCLSLPGGYLFCDDAAVVGRSANRVRDEAPVGGGPVGAWFDRQRTGATRFCLGQ